MARGGDENINATKEHLSHDGVRQFMFERGQHLGTGEHEKVEHSAADDAPERGNPDVLHSKQLRQPVTPPESRRAGRRRRPVRIKARIILLWNITHWRCATPRSYTEPPTPHELVLVGNARLGGLLGLPSD